MLKLNKDQQRIPLGGHHFSKHGTTFRGETFQEVVSKLSDFRVANSLQLGDPEQDVLQFYATNWPYMVTSDGLSKPIDPQHDYEKWRKWVFDTWRRPPIKFIIPSEAEERWKVCEKCPFLKKKSWPNTKEAAEVARKAFILARGMKTPEFLGFCSLHLADLPALVFVDQPKSFSGMKDGETFKDCWVSKI